MSERNVSDDFEPARITACRNHGARWGIRRTADCYLLPWVFATKDDAAAFIAKHQGRPSVMPRAVAEKASQP